MKSIKMKLLAGLLAAAVAIPVGAQLIYGNTFPFWNVNGPLTVVGATSLTGATTITGTTGITGATTVTGALVATTSVTSPIIATSGYQKVTAPRVITGATDTPTVTDNYLIANRAGTVTLTLDPTNTGRRLCVKTIQAQTVVSGASDVAPIDTVTGGTAILAGTAGKWACMVSNGTIYIIVEAG